MFDRQFFADVLSGHVATKSKNSASGGVTVRIKTTDGETWVVSTIEHVGDGYVVMSVYPKKGKPRETPREERNLGAPRFDLDQFAIPFGYITRVEITTAEPAAPKYIGFTSVEKNAK